MMPLSVRNWHRWWKLEENLLIFKEIDKDSAVLCLDQNPLVDGVVFMINRVEREIGSSLIRGVKGNPHGNGQFITLEPEWHHE